MTSKRFITASNLFINLWILAVFIAFFICFGQEKAIASTADLSVIERVTEKFLLESQNWASKLEGSVKDLFILLFTLELVMLGITAVMKRQSLEDTFASMVMSVLFGAFILACIMNYKEWSYAIMSGLAQTTGLLGYNAADIVMNPMSHGFKIFDLITNETSVWSPIDSLVYILVGFAILISFAFITIQIIYIKCEAFVAVGAGFILLGFGGCHFFKDYAINLMKYILSVGFKLYVLYIVLGLGFHFLETLPPVDALEWADLSVVLIATLVILTLSKALPDVAAGLIQGAHVNTGHHAMQTATQVGAMAGVATAGTMAAAGGLNTIKKGVDVAKSGGATGIGGITAGATKAIWNAHKQHKAERPTTSTGAINSKLDAMHAQNKLENK